MKMRTLILCFALILEAEYMLAQFHLNGSAVQFNDTCWTLTPDELWQSGSIWNVDKVNLDNSFQVIMELKLGCRDGDGADGILFGLQPVSTSIGQQGEGLGFQGVSPSLGIEFDTWQNSNLNDPSVDHIAIIKNGNLNHKSGNNLAGPVQANTANANMEDCNWHKLRVNWDALTKTLEVWFDCDLRLSYTGDIVNQIFGGDPNVFWGFTSATGGARNLHQVCFSYTTFLDGFEDVVIGPGGQFQLKLSGGVKYKWTPATGLNNPNIPNPIAAPKETTTYAVEVTDACNNPFFDSLTVFVDGDTVFFELGADTMICEGQQLQLDATSFGTDTVTYLWSNGQTTPSVNAMETGLYTVTVTIDKYCVADDRVFLEVIPLPAASLPGDTSLCRGQTLMLDATAAFEQEYTWQDGKKGALYTVILPGRYTVIASNFCGEKEVGVEVSFEDCRQVYFPNSFSPNGDGNNDYFLPLDGGDVEIVRYFKVFDRWGGLVHEAVSFRPNDTSMGWDGRVDGSKANGGVYTWVAEVMFRDGNVEMKAGSVNLVR
jgi:gliding motility-associated-like protein